MKNENGLTFEQFLEELDNHMEDMCGLSHEHISDYDYWNSWADGCDPAEVAENALLEAGLEF